jgi:hypothetical protein
MCLLLRRHVEAQPQRDVCKDDGMEPIEQERTTYYRVNRRTYQMSDHHPCGFS